MAFGWVGNLTRLVPLDKSKHMANAITWLNDPIVTEWVSVGDFPLTRIAEEEYFDTVAKQSDSAAHFAIETTESVHIGFSGIVHIDWRHGFAVTGSFIGRTDFWGKGYGSDAVQVRTRYAFEVLGLRVLLSETLAGNDRSLRMLKAAGYSEVGRIPERYWKRGAHRDLLQLAVTRDEWRARESASRTEAARRAKPPEAPPPAGEKPSEVSPAAGGRSPEPPPPADEKPSGVSPAAGERSPEAPPPSREPDDRASDAPEGRDEKGAE